MTYFHTIAANYCKNPKISSNIFERYRRNRERQKEKEIYFEFGAVQKCAHLVNVEHAENEWLVARIDFDIAENGPNYGLPTLPTYDPAQRAKKELRVFSHKDNHRKKKG